MDQATVELRGLKAEAARRQLGTATALFIEDKDPISVHTLVGAAWDILRGLLKDQGILGTLDISQEFLTLQNAPFKAHNLFALHYNALKHYTHTNGEVRQDTDLIQNFTDSDNDFQLFGAWIDYQNLGYKLPAEARIFLSWVLKSYPEAIGDNLGKIADLDAIFPTWTAIRSDQKNALRAAISDIETRSAFDNHEMTDKGPLLYSIEYP